MQPAAIADLPVCAGIVRNYDVQSDFRDRTSSLETLLSSTQGVTDASMIVFYEKEFEPQYQRFLQTFSVAASLTFPVDEAELRAALLSISTKIG